MILYAITESLAYLLNHIANGDEKQIEDDRDRERKKGLDEKPNKTWKYTHAKHIKKSLKIFSGKFGSNII